MNNIRQITARLLNSSVAWFWAFNGLRLVSGILVLPLLLRLLPADDLGMYYVFLSIAALVPIVDFGFGGAIGRFVSYAMGGATELHAVGMTQAGPGAAVQPNYALVWALLRTARTLYRYLALVALVALGVWGTYLVGIKVHESFSPAVTWAAWTVTLIGCAFEIYTSWWNNFLIAMNKVTESARIGVLAYSVRLVISCVLLLLGCGLLSVPLASFFGSVINRWLSRRHCLSLLGQSQPGNEVAVRSMFAILWPNSWRLGLLALGNYFRTNANTAICAAALGLAATAEYGLSVQLMQIAVGMAAVWTYVKWPLVGQLRTKGDFTTLQRMLRVRFWLQMVTLLVLAMVVVLAGPYFLRLIGSTKTLLPTGWMIVIAIVGVLDLQFSFWTTLIMTANRMPFLWPSMATNVLSFVLSLAFVYVAGLGVGGLILGPLLAGSLFNYWYWPLAGARSIETGLLRFLFAPGQTQTRTQ